MAVFKVRTKDGSSHDGKPKVYFTCHPDDFELFFDKICNDIFATHSCAIYYTEDMSAPLEENNLDADIGSKNLIVIPVTYNLVNKPCRAMSVDVPYAKKKGIPILPIMMESDIGDLYSKESNFGERQYLDSYSNDASKISYAEKLRNFLEAKLISEEMAKLIRAEFDAYVFLSYRKKDRRYANELMRVIHAIPGCRDIAIWYDEFLTLGESWRENIREAMERVKKQSNLFALLVTPNLLEEYIDSNGVRKKNFVMEIEYPDALSMGMDILPTEVEKTNHKELKEKFEDIPDCVYPSDERFVEIVLNIFSKIAVSKNDNEPEHNFLIGLAYLDGIDVEVDTERAIDLITSSAEAGLPEAMEKLYEIFFIGTDNVKNNFNKALVWAERLVDYYTDKYGLEHHHTLRSLKNLAHVQGALGEKDRAIETYHKIYALSDHITDVKSRIDFLDSLAYDYAELDDYDSALDVLNKLYIMRREMLGEYHLETVRVLHNIAYAHQKLNDYEGSLEIFEKVYDIRCSLLGFDHRDTLETLNNMSVVLGKIGNHQKALEYKNTVYSLRCKTLGDKHPDTVRALSNMAHTYSQLGLYEQAIECGEKAYDLRCEIIGEEHPSTLTTLNIVAVAYGRMGDRKALELHQRVYELRKKILGEENWKTQLAKRNLDHIRHIFEK